MRLRDVANVGEILARSGLADDQLWDRPVETLTEGDIVLYYARVGLHKRKQAVDTIERIQSAVIVAAFQGNEAAGKSSIITHSPPSDPFLVDELVEGLSRLSVERRRACLFALEMKLDPPFVTTLTWASVPSPSQRQGASRLAQEILDECAKTRHIRLPYVFWEWATPRIAAPMIDLRMSVELAFSCTWPELVEKHSRMITISRSADATSFLRLAEEVRAGRL